MFYILGVIIQVQSFINKCLSLISSSELWSRITLHLKNRFLFLLVYSTRHTDVNTLLVCTLFLRQQKISMIFEMRKQQISTFLLLFILHVLKVLLRGSSTICRENTGYPMQIMSVSLSLEKYSILV